MKTSKVKNILIDTKDGFYYGNVSLRSIGAFNVNDLDELFKNSSLLTKEFNSIFCEGEKDNLSYREFLNYASSDQIVVEIFVSIEGDNPDWFEKNKDGIMQGNLGKTIALAEKMGSLAQEKMSYSIRQLKAWNNSKLKRWCISTRSALNSNWIKGNTEYVNALDEMIAAEYKKMKESADIGYRLGLLGALDLGLDLSFDDNYVLKKLSEKGNIKLIEDLKL